MNVRKATGRRVDGGSKIGNIDVFVGGACVFCIRKGLAGVPNAGDDEGIGSVAPILKRSGCRGVRVGSMVVVRWAFSSPLSNDDQNIEIDVANDIKTGMILMRGGFTSREGFLNGFLNSFPTHGLH